MNLAKKGYEVYSESQGKLNAHRWRNLPWLLRYQYSWKTLNLGNLSKTGGDEYNGPNSDQGQQPQGGPGKSYFIHQRDDRLNDHDC